LLGVTFTALIQYAIEWTDQEVTAWEAVMMVTAWPVMVLVFIWHFVKGLLS